MQQNNMKRYTVEADRGKERQRKGDNIIVVQFKDRVDSQWTSQGNKVSSCSGMSKENTLILLSTLFNPYT